MNTLITEILKDNDLLNQEALTLGFDAGNIFKMLPKNINFTDAKVIAVIDEIASKYGIIFTPHIKYKSLPKDIIKKIPFDYLQKHNIAPFAFTDNKLHIALKSLNQRDKIDHLRLILSDFTFETHLCLPEDIENVLQNIFNEKDFIDYEILEVDDLKQGIDLTKIETKKTQITSFADNIIAEAIRINATDIHLHPELNEFKLFYRINGILQLLKTIPKNIYAEIISRLKIMASLDITKKNMPQDGSFSFKFTDSSFVDIRISFIPTTNDERVVMRILNHDKIFRPLTDLGMNKKEEALISKNIKRSGGMILVNGPTGSGKTTSLYAALDIINNGDKNIITIEDPVEYNLKGVAQMQVNNNMQFATALRSILRQDPDVIMIGEIRDEETAKIAIRSALTGHLVLSTLHTNNAIQSIIRLTEIGIKPYLITSAVTLSISQRLVRILCDKCKTPITKHTEIINRESAIFKEGCAGIFEAKGCNNCFNTGYIKREAIYEMVELTPVIKEMINNKTSEQDIYNYLLEKTDFLPLQHNLLLKVREGKTSLDEYLRILN